MSKMKTSRGKRIPSALVALGLALLTLGAAVAPARQAARPGTLLHSFGHGGVEIRQFGVEPGAGGGRQVVPLAGGGLLVRTGGGSIGRFRADGSLDTDFGEAGYLIAASGTWGAMAVDAEGRIVLATIISSPSPSVTVSRYRTGGSPDRSFGEGGSRTIELAEPFNGAPAAVLVQPDGKLLVAAAATASAQRREPRVEALRLLPSGRIDRGYGADGFALVPLPSSVGTAELHAVSLDGDGLVAALSGGETDLLLIRIGPGGQLDPSLGGDGMVRSKLGQSDAASVGVLADGRIQVASFGRFVSRFLADGEPDPSFGEGGVATVPLPLAARLSAGAIGPDGSTLVGGSLFDQADWHASAYFLARLGPDGAPDASFGAGGIASTDFGATAGGSVELRGLALRADGYALAVGRVPAPDGPSSRVETGIAAWAPDGQLDPAFGAGGTVVARPLVLSRDWASDLIVDRRGRAVVTGRAAGGVLLARYRRDGRLDRSFRGGSTTLAVNPGYRGEEGLSLARYPGNEILLGTASERGADVVRLHADGSPDTSFGHGGAAPVPKLNRVADLAATTGGRILVAGFANGPCHAALVRLTPRGTLDPGFGKGGRVGLGQIAGPCRERNLNLALRPNGRILVGGNAGSGFLREYSATGRREDGFGGNRMARILPRRPAAIAVDDRGRILVAGRIGHRRLGAVRLTRRGHLDTGFGRRGTASLRLVGSRDQASDMSVQADGRIVVAGTARLRGESGSDSYRPLVARFTAGGSVDRDFGDRGLWTSLPRRASRLNAVALGRGSILAAGSSGPDIWRSQPLLLGLRR